MFKKKATSRNRWAKPDKSTPTIDRDWGRVRLAVVAVFFCAIWVLLWFRAWDIQIIQGPRLTEKVIRQQTGTELITGFRGSILDRNGQVLARSVEVRSVYVRPYEIQDVTSASISLAKILEMNRTTVLKALNSSKSFVWLKRKVDDRTAAEVSEAKIKGIDLATEFERVYPFKQLAGQLLGFVNIDDVGLEGIEKAFDNELSAHSSRIVVQRDATGRKLYLAGSEDRSDLKGNDIELTIDTQIQYFAEESLAKAVIQNEAKWGGCLVVDIPSGEILAWAEYPFFNPNAYRKYPSPSVWRTRLSTDALEHGSTLKPLLIAAALTEKQIRPDSRFFCENGLWKTKRFSIRDTSNRGWLNIEEILRYSSNIGAAKIGMQMGAPLYHDYLRRIGFGERTGLPVIGESHGILRHAKQWAEVDLATASFGQSFSANSLQVAEAYLILTNGGVKKSLKLVKGFEEEEQEERVFSQEAADTVLQMLSGVVEQDGSGQRARIPGVEVGGKTGTAQKAAAGSYGKGRLSSFIGIAPLDNPRYLVITMLDEPQKSAYGGVVAAPVFRHVVSRSLAYKGELPDPTMAKVEIDQVAEIAKSDIDPSELSKKPGEDVVGVIPKANTKNLVSSVSSNITDKSTQSKAVVPNVVGTSVRSAMENFMRLGITPTIKGQGYIVVRQSPEPGITVTDSDKVKCILWMSEQGI